MWIRTETEADHAATRAVGAVAGLSCPGAPPGCFMALAFGDALPRGAVRHHPAFASGDG